MYAINLKSYKLNFFQNKWQLLPHFLRLMRQHIASFDYFVETEIKKVVAAERGSATKQTIVFTAEADMCILLCNIVGTKSHCAFRS